MAGSPGKMQKTTHPAPMQQNRPSFRTLLPRILNALLWLVFCAMAGTGLLLAFRLPPGSRGGRGLSAWGMSRHEWGDWHTWLSYAFLALILVHLVLHWRWFWQVASRKKAWPLMLGFGTGLLLLAVLALQPVTTNGGTGNGSPQHHLKSP